MDDDGVLDDADADEGVAEEVDEALLEDADDDALGARGVRQGAEEVEGRPHAKRLADGRDEAHRRVVLRRVEEAEADGVDAVRHVPEVELEVQT